jgi:hypothetical protein
MIKVHVIKVGVTAALLTMFFLFLSSCSNKIEFGIAVSDYKNRSIYYTNTFKGGDSIFFEHGYWSIPPDDACFVNRDVLAYHGKFVVDFSKGNSFKKYALKKTEPEQFFSKVVDTKNEILLVDSVDVAYLTSDKFTLEGYSIDLNKKLFSIYLTDGAFGFNKYVDTEIPNYYFVSDYAGWVTKKDNKVFRVLNLEKSSLDTLEMFYMKDDLMYGIGIGRDSIYSDVDVRRARVISDYQFSYMKINRKLNSDENWFEIIRYDCKTKEKEQLFKSTLPISADIYRYRIIKNRLFLAANDKIYSLSKKGEWKAIYKTESENKKILDFVPL